RRGKAETSVPQVGCATRRPVGVGQQRRALARVTHVLRLPPRRRALRLEPASMKTTLVRVGAVLLFVALAAAGTGCASSNSSTPKKPKLDPRTTEWNNYIGHYTYEQALQDLGKPAIVGET